MSDDEPLTPRVELTLARTACRVHGEPFRAEWPKGWLTYSLQAFATVLADEQLAESVRGDLAKVTALLDRSPLCARMGPAERLKAYLECGLGEVALCASCVSRKLGTLYQMGDVPVYTGTITEHICFGCVAHRGCQL